MNPRTTAVLAAVAAVLGLFVYLNEFEGERKRQAAADEAAKIHPGLVATDVDAVELETLDGIAARFERRDGRWRLVAPFEARAEGSALDAIVSALVDLPREGTVEGDKPVAGFGLADDAKAVRFEAGSRRLGLRLGRTTPVGGHRYVARLADDEVSYVESYRLNAFNRNLSDLRDRRILDFESGSVDRLRIAWPEGDDPASSFAVVLERADAEGDSDAEAAGAAGATFSITEPIEAEADPNVVRDLLSDLVYLRAKDFLPAGGAGLAEGSSDTAEVEAALAQTAIAFSWSRVAGDGGGSVEGSLRIGGEARGGRVVETSNGERYTIAAERIDDFPRRLVAYRFKQLSAFELASARRLELTLSPETGAEARSVEPLRVLATLEAEGWRSAERSLDPDAVSALVRLLSSLDADDLVADEMGEAELASLGLSPPRGRLRVEGRLDPDGPMEALADLEFGRRDPERGVFVRRADREAVFLVAPEIADALPVSAEAWREGFEVAENENEDEDVDQEGDTEDEDAGLGGAEDAAEFGAIE